MSKRATKKIVETRDSRKASPKRTEQVSLAGASEPVPSAALKGVMDAGIKQEFSSREQALGFFIDSIVSKLGDDPASQREMREFLKLLIDTDPALCEELVQSVRTRE
jgi:hypothetical protein